VSGIDGRIVAMTTDTDPRLHYRTALAWVRDLAAAVPADRLTDPTPCPDFDVRALLGHLVATVDRTRVIGEGGDPNAEPRVVVGGADDSWTAALDAAAEKMWPVWADDARLDAPVTVPWGTVPGRAALWGYLREALVHGWDLAVATGQDPEADHATAAAALEVTQRVFPAEPRTDMPFAPPVAPRAGAGPTERLANWCGHARR
jgi:uncharacterized protein (TIGR03086 family)